MGGEPPQSKSWPDLGHNLLQDVCRTVERSINDHPGSSTRLRSRMIGAPSSCHHLSRLGGGLNGDHPYSVKAVSQGLGTNLKTTFGSAQTAVK